MNLELLVQRIQRYRRRELLIDANLLLLYFIGARRADLIPSFDRTSQYTLDDFALLETFMSQFRRMTTTPHILTEVSNLMGHCQEPLRSELRRWLSQLIQTWSELAAPSKLLAKATHFPRFGLTDTAIADVPRRSCLILTNDHPLAGFLQKRGLDVVRFSDLQAACL